MTNSIEIRNLSFQYGNQVVLDNINLSVPMGSIYGFLGPNGAGKTTTLRLILGLLQLKSGSIKVLDHHFATHRLEILKKVGSLVEYPSIYGHLTASFPVAAFNHFLCQIFSSAIHPHFVFYFI